MRAAHIILLYFIDYKLKIADTFNLIQAAISQNLKIPLLRYRFMTFFSSFIISFFILWRYIFNLYQLLQISNKVLILNMAFFCMPLEHYYLPFQITPIYNQFCYYLHLEKILSWMLLFWAITMFKALGSFYWTYCIADPI